MGETIGIKQMIDKNTADTTTLTRVNKINTKIFHINSK